MLGRFIDNDLTDEERDRIIEAPSMSSHVWFGEDGSACLIMTAKGVSQGTTYVWGRVNSADVNEYLTAVQRYDRLCNRFGNERVVRAIKLRAGKNNRVAVRETADVSLPQEVVPA